MADMAETADWVPRLRREGYVVLRDLVPADRVTAARAAIEHDLDHRFDPAARATYEHNSYCPALRASPPITDLLASAGVQAALAAILDPARLSVAPAQIAVRFAREAAEPILPRPHIDGIPRPHNGLPQDGRLHIFTLLVGVFLTPLARPFAGNLAVWPRSHDLHRYYFRGAGEAGLRHGQPPIDLDAPVQLLAEPGDVVLAHYALAHAAVPNASDLRRIAVYFRAALPDVRERSLHYLTHPHDGWRGRSAD